MTNSTEQGDLTPAEAHSIVQLSDSYHAARAAGDYSTSDVLRANLVAAGVLAPDYRRWHPVFEAPAHRAHRLSARGVAP